MFSEEDVLAFLSDALPHAGWCDGGKRAPDDEPGYRCPCDDNRLYSARYLLPVVSRVAGQCAADALRDVSDEMVAGLGVGSYNPAAPYVGAIRDDLRARADRLAPAAEAKP